MLMMQMIQQLAACKSYNFSGWFLAEASLCLEGKAHSFSLEICRKTERRAVLQVLGWDEGGRCRQSLTVLLVKPLSLSREIISAEAEGAPDGEVLWRHVFSDEEILDYLAISGDANEIHRGKGAVVPGLCFLERLLSSLDEDDLRWRCKFRKPVYAGEELCLVETAAGIEGYVGGRLVNTIERLPYKERVHDEINNI